MKISFYSNNIDDEVLLFESEITEIVNNDEKPFKFTFNVRYSEIKGYKTIEDICEKIYYLATPDGQKITHQNKYMQWLSKSVYPRTVTLKCPCTSDGVTHTYDVLVVILSAEISLKNNDNDETATITLNCLPIKHEDTKIHQKQCKSVTVLNCPCEVTILGDKWKNIRTITWIKEYFHLINEKEFDKKCEEVLSQISNELQIPVFVEEELPFIYKNRYHDFVFNELKQRLDKGEVFDALERYRAF